MLKVRKSQIQFFFLFLLIISIYSLGYNDLNMTYREFKTKFEKVELPTD